MRAIGMVCGGLLAIPYLILFNVIRLVDLWLSGNLRDAVAIPCDRASTHRP